MKQLSALIQHLQTPLTPQRFSVCVGGFVVCGLACIALFNWTINPFGQYSSHCLAPIVQESRRQKVDLFENLEAEPEGLILGSSRALKFEPHYLLQRTSKTFFNFAVNHGRPEDYLAIVRYYRHRFGHYPKTLLIGVDVAALNDVVPDDARLTAEPRLYAFAKETSWWNDEFDRFSQLFSYRQFTSSIDSLRRCILPSVRERDEAYDSDGVIQYVKRQSQMESNSYDFEAALDFNEREHLAIFGQLREPSQRRLGYLRDTLQLCSENGCKVYLFSTVSHPRLRELLATKTKFLHVEQAAVQAIEGMASRLGATFVDFSSIDSFSGDPHCFVDGIHPLEPNTRRMIDRLIPRSNEASYAFQ
jgi:hypothetical protein